MSSPIKLPAPDGASVANYSALIDSLFQIQAATNVPEKTRILKKLGNFLAAQGYRQLGEVITNKAAEITHHV